MYIEYPKEQLHFLLNSWHTPIGDFFFKYYTQLAEWPLYIIGLLPLFFHRHLWTLLYALSEVMGGTIIQALKYIYESPRPAAFFEKFPDLVLPIVEGVKLHHSNSFPSGHSSSFFIFCTFCTLLISIHYYKEGRIKPHSAWYRTLILMCVFLFFTLAVLGGYSRIYLSQHFFIDVFVGSLIGVSVPCIVVTLFRKKLLQ